MNGNSNRYKVLAAGIVIQFCAGVIYMWSVFRNPVSEFLGWDKAAASLTSSVMLVAFVAGLFFGGRIMDRIGPKLTCILGTVMMSLGILTSSFVPSTMPELIYLTYGIIGGFGVGTVYTCTVSPIQKWFPDRRGFATGLMVGAFGFSLVIFAPLANMMLAELGVSTTFQVFGMAFLVICGAASLFISNPAAVTNGVPTTYGDRRQYTTSEMLRSPQYYLITISLFLVLPAYFILNPLFMSMGMDRGLSEAMAITGVMISGIASASGRLVLTWVSDHIGRLTSIFVIITFTAIGSILAIFAENVMFLVCIAMIAFAFGGAAGVYTAVTSDVFGAKNMGSNYGYVMLGFGASALVFPFLSNVLSKDGDYTMIFTICVVTCIAAFVCIMMLRSRFKVVSPKGA